MKTTNSYILFQLFGFLCLFSLSSYGQLIVYAGKDTTYCPGVGKMYLGNNVTIENGVEPYSIKWESKVELTEHLTYTAKDFLNDTTLLSPVITAHTPWPEWIKFIIHVRDSKNNYARDSINVRFSTFILSMGYHVVELKKGDSILFNQTSVHGGIEPLKFHWQPTTGLSNPDTLVTWCKTDSLTEYSTQYNIIAIDSCGCVSSPNLMYEVRVLQTGFNEVKNDTDNLLNIRQSGKSIYFNNPFKQEAHIAIYTVNGELKYNLTIREDNFETDKLLKNEGIYVVKISLGAKVGSCKFLNFEP